MGTGVGEVALMDAVLTGAAVGGGSAAITGGDPLKGALLGGLTGGAGGALFGGAGGAGAGAGLDSAIAAGGMPGAAAAEGISPEYANLLMKAPAASSSPGLSSLLPTTTAGKIGLGAAGLGGLALLSDRNRFKVPELEKYNGPLSKLKYDPSTYTPYTYQSYADGGTVERMSNDNAMGANTGYPQADISQGAYATPWQTPISRNVVAGSGDANVDQMTGQERMAGGGIASLGSYSDGGRLLRGPGDGMSDNIPATIGRKQPARLADGEFVVPADVVSGLGNGSTDAGAKQLYKMLDKVRTSRTGTKKQGKEINPNKYMPA